MMKIAYDAKRITNNFTGLGNYSRFVVNNLAEQFIHDEFLFFSPNEAKGKIRMLISKNQNLKFLFPEKKMNSISKNYWRSWGIAKDIIKNKPDIYHGLTNELPLSIEKTGIPSIVTIHDLIFLNYPRFYKSIDRKIYNYKAQKACENATHIVAVSQCTKRDLVKHYKISPNKISVVYQGCSTKFMQKASNEDKEELASKFNLPQNFILSVGTIEERKNLLLVLKALKVSNLNNKLVVVGRHTKYMNKLTSFIAENKMQEQVIFLKEVDANDLPLIYQQASLFVYPSLYEGFGIPVIEALHSEVPVIAATGSCLEEAGGESSLYVNPHDYKDLAEKMKWVLGDKQQQNRMISESLNHVKQFEHAKLTKQMMDLYKNVIARF